MASHEYDYSYYCRKGFQKLIDVIAVYEEGRVSSLESDGKSLKEMFNFNSVIFSPTPRSVTAKELEGL